MSSKGQAITDLFDNFLQSIDEGKTEQTTSFIPCTPPSLTSSSHIYFLDLGNRDLTFVKEN